MQTRGQDYLHIPRVEIRINPSANDMLSGENIYLLRFMQIDGVKYVIRLKSDPATVNTKLFTKVWENTKWEIYVFDNMSPRIFWTSEFAVGKSNADLLTKVFRASSTQIILGQSSGVLSTHGGGTYKVLQYTPDKIEVQTNADKKGFVYISDNYVPQWKAYVDGTIVQVERANYSFMAVPVSEGKHTIVLKYQDSKETIAFVISGVGLVFVIVGLIIAKKKKYL
jgi:hypothetical protein